MACLILIAVIWTSLRLSPAPAAGRMARSPRRLAPTAAAILLLVVAQIALGGLVAGLKAGLIYDTWPLIDGAFIPGREHLFFLQPAWTNLIGQSSDCAVRPPHGCLSAGGLAALHAADCGVPG